MKNKTDNCSLETQRDNSAQSEAERMVNQTDNYNSETHPLQRVHPLMGGNVELKETSKITELMMDQTGLKPCFDTLILGAIAMLELAVNCAPCTNPEGDCWDAIKLCKKAILSKLDL